MDGEKHVDYPVVPTSIDGLRSLSDADLERAIRESNHTLGGGDILDEAGRREAHRQTATTVRLTWAILVFTIVVAVATIINAGVFIARSG